MQPYLLQLRCTADIQSIGLRTGARLLPVTPQVTWSLILPGSVSVKSSQDSTIQVYSGAQETVVIGSLSDIAAWLQRQATSTPSRTAMNHIDAVRQTPSLQTLRGRPFIFDRPRVMGIVNVTPDSFSDGGRYVSTEAAVAHGLRLVSEGADLLDIGGESTRPKGAAYGDGAQTVSVVDEIARVVPVVRALRSQTDVPLSVDTRKSAVARAALQAGADMINDVSGLLHDPALATVCAEHDVPLCLMHTPADIEQLQHEQPANDILSSVIDGLSQAIDRALKAGMNATNLWIDPGLGFGKTVPHNLWLLNHLEAVVALGFPVLVGASRKSFLGAASVRSGQPVPPAPQRLGASVAAALLAAQRGAHVLRVHDVAETVQALRAQSAIMNACDGMAAS